ncbi:Heterokaryon incompatibility protein 6, OR allele [Cercospora beticola]|uniref:Heterokaryon incompatibility protein 6, OR allele n=1 Tax=Cercospora beticola TaxID=122368 RepID=A0A2G5HXF4_CERBT|nr:Heterokaryon incompatibility protein 6, OR allele [Cercospora beticola]PIA97229.1 Heterokaryon incompatibility protein 6, OR allele [Cercospora beticola]WPA98565.1 hypothetical protein RHO25_003177 [Cercospora beticola]
MQTVRLPPPLPPRRVPVASKAVISIDWMETGVVSEDDSTKIVELPPLLPARPIVPTAQLAQVSIFTREVDIVTEETTHSEPSAPALPPRPMTITSNYEQPSIEDLEEDVEVSSTVTLLATEGESTTQQSLYTSLPFQPTSQIRILEIQPGPLNSPIICNLVVQDIDLTTPRRPPPTIHGDMLGDMFNSKGVIDYFRRNTSKDDFIRDLRPWMPKSYRERYQEKVVAAHAAESALPAFNALSYTWGSWDDSTSITIVNSESGEEVEFPVTRNLFNALRRIRREQEDVIRLWVDQICINQRDEEEKAWQVRAMGNIYSLAWDVFIWLGDLDDEDLEPLKSNCSEGRRQIAERLLEVMEHAEATWWTRTWCIQEFMMARQDPIALFADCQIRWTEAVSAGKKVKEDRELRAFKPSNLKKHIWKNDDSKPEPEPDENDPVELVGAPFFSFQRIKYMSSGVRTLASMYWAYSQTEATDPRDKVYSLLALIEPAESALVEIDYKKPVPWVYAEATYASILASGNIHILGLVKGDRSDLELPSWCVDFSYAGKAINQSWIDTGDFSQYLFAPVDASREAKKSAGEKGGNNQVLPWTNRLQCATAKASLSVRRQLLVLRGLEFDVVVKTIHKRTRKVYWDNLKTSALDLLKAPLGLFFDGPIMLTKNEQAAFQSVLDLMEGAGSPYEKLARNARVTESLASTLGSEEDLDSTTSEDEEKVSMFSFRLFDVWSRRFLRGHVSGLTKVAWRRYGLWKLYFRHLCHGDAFFFTSNGFIGLGHIDCQVGDRIILLYGSRHPVLLRPDNGANRHKFLGFCFVNGIMDDELRKLAPDLVLGEKEFVLR